MKKMIAVLMLAVIGLSLISCGSNVEKIKNFDELDTTKFWGFLNGDGDFLVMYEGVIDDAVMGATLTAENGASVVLSKDTITKNGDGYSLLYFAECKVEVGSKVQLTLAKEGYESLTFTVEVQQ